MTQEARASQVEGMDTKEIAQVFYFVGDVWKQYATDSAAGLKKYWHQLIREYVREEYTVAEFVQGTTKETLDYIALEFEDVSAPRRKALEGLAVEVVTLLSFMEFAVNTGDRVWFEQLSRQYMVALHGCRNLMRQAK